MRLSNIPPTFYKAIILTTFLALIVADSAFGQDQTVTITTIGQGESLQKATDNALRSAIEQTFGAFISARTEILNDKLVSDQIASVASGNIQSYEVLAQTQLSKSQWSVSLQTVVSVTKLTSFVQARGVQVEIQGGLFAANIRQQILNEEAEIEAVRNMVGVLHELFQTSYDYEIEVGNPVATDAKSINWKIPLTITATVNENMQLASEFLESTLYALSLREEEWISYNELEKESFIVDILGAPYSCILRRVESYDMLIGFSLNLYEAYPKLYLVDSGIDQKVGLGSDDETGASLRRHWYLLPPDVVIYMLGTANEQYWRGDKYCDRGNYGSMSVLFTNCIGNHIKISFLDIGQTAGVYKYDDLRTLNEIGEINNYIVKPQGIISRVTSSDVYNPVTGKTWMDRNIGALWPAIQYIDRESYGLYFTYEEAKLACPIGYRLPTTEEWVAELSSWASNESVSSWSELGAELRSLLKYKYLGAYSLTLKLPFTGNTEQRWMEMQGDKKTGKWRRWNVWGDYWIGFEQNSGKIGSVRIMNTNWSGGDFHSFSFTNDKNKKSVRCIKL